MNSSPPAFEVDLTWPKTWPLYTVYPLTTAAFVSLYFLGPKFWPLLVPKYSKMSVLNQQCWRQNTNSLIHATIVTIATFVAVVTDPYMRESRPLHPHMNWAGYIAICVSLAHFIWTIPWSYRLYFFKGERHATNLALCIHHAIVFVACLTYLIFRTCALYGAVAYAAMEFTNMFFVPHILQQQYRSKWYTFWNVNYVVLVVNFVALRLVICTWMAVVFSQDLAAFRSDSILEWAVVILQYIIFLAVTLLSWVWLWNGIQELGILPKIQKAMRKLFTRSSAGTSTHTKVKEVSKAGSRNAVKTANPADAI